MALLFKDCADKKVSTYAIWRTFAKWKLGLPEEANILEFVALIPYWGSAGIFKICYLQKILYPETILETQNLL